MTAPLNAILAAQIIINAWDNWTDEAETESDNILQAAAAYAKVLLVDAPHQIPTEVYVWFATAVTVITDTPIPGITDKVADLTFDEAITPLRNFVYGATNPTEAQQLVARIKRGSKYAHQAPPGGWFDVRKINRGYPEVDGNNNAYRRSDVNFGIRLADGSIVELKR